MRGQPVKIVSLVTTLLLGSPALVGQEPPVLRGEWAATSGSTQTLRGQWIGQALPAQPNAVHGSWTLASGAGRTVLSGTWSARKRGQGWRGTWSARDRYSRTYSGTWKAGETNVRGKSLQGLLEQTLKNQISGSWRSRRLHGQWWLKGTSPPPRNN